jgi:hypothetical protein
MDKNTVQIICATIITLAELWYLNPGNMNMFAWLWDFIARVTGELANMLGYISMEARVRYFTVVNYGA